MTQAVVFDKDGTLLDFEATWNSATQTILTAVTRGDAERLQGVASDVGFDLATGTILAGSPLISESNAVIGALILPWSDPTLELTEVELNQIASRAAADNLVAMPGADATLTALHDRGIALAVATNDSQIAAELTLDRLGWRSLFAAAVGYDSGYGAKPDPGMVLGALSLVGIDPSEALMVGDSSHDIDAGSAAGCTTVLIGPAPVEADHSITALPQLLDLIS